MKPTLAYPSWSQIDKGCALLSKQVIHSEATGNYVPELIIGLARGGLVPSVIISHILELKVFPISYSSKTGNGEYKEYENVLPDVPGKNIMLIDDIVDSGHTLKEVVQAYEDRDYNVLTAALYYKTSSVFKPDFYWQEIPADSPWIIFPWEI